MLDIGGWEFMLVAFVLIIVVGPKELPKMLRGFTRIMTQVRSMAREFTDGMNDLAREADMDDILKNSEISENILDGVYEAVQDFVEREVKEDSEDEDDDLADDVSLSLNEDEEE